MEFIQLNRNFVENVIKRLKIRGGSSVGRATGLHPVGRRFDSYSLHQNNKGPCERRVEKSRLASFRTVGVFHTTSYLRKLPATLAQLVEQMLCKHQVLGSNPRGGSILDKTEKAGIIVL